MNQSPAPRLGIVLLAVLLLLAPGCGRDDGKKTTAPDDGGNDGTPTYTQDVQPIIQSGCGCHHPGGGVYAAAPLDTYQAVYARRSAVRQRAGVDGSMPPGNPLPQDRRDTIIAWVDGGAPE